MNTNANATDPDALLRPGGLSQLFDLSRPDVDVAAAFTAARMRFDLCNTTYLGFPVAAIDLPHSDAIGRGRFFNNIGSATLPAPGQQHAWEAEREVLRWFARLVGVAPDQAWGHLTTGGSAGNVAGLRRGRDRFPDAVLLHSERAHYSVPDAADLLRIPAIAVPVLPNEQIDLGALDDLIGTLRTGRPAGELAVIVVATLGTTRTEACDDLDGIVEVLTRHRITRRHLHLDAALAGLPMALDGRLTLETADTVSTSIYKFIGVPRACGLVLGHGTPSGRTDRVIPYTATVGTTGVRDGITALATWEAIATHGIAGHRRRAHASRDLADYTIGQLHRLGVAAWRHDGAYFTVVLPSPPDAVLRKWTLGPSGDGRHRIVLVPGRRREQVDAFLPDLSTALATPPQPRRNLFAVFLDQGHR